MQSLGVETPEVTGTDEALKLEREIKKLLPDIPELQDFFGFRRKKDVLVPDLAGALNADWHQGVERTFPGGDGTSNRNPGPLDVGEEPGESLVENKNGTERATPIGRTVRQGPKIAFIPAADRVDLGWVDGSRIVINSSHPSYLRIVSDAKARHLHNILAIGSALQRFLSTGEETPDPLLLDRILASWGKSDKA